MCKLVYMQNFESVISLVYHISRVHHAKKAPQRGAAYARGFWLRQSVATARANLRCFVGLSYLSRSPRKKSTPKGVLRGGRERARTSDLYHVKVAL